MKRAVILLLLVAAAPDRPTIPPARDAAVTYRTSGAAAALIPNMGGGEGTGQMRLRWNAAGLLRLEAEGRPQTLLLDLRSKFAHIVDTSLRSAVLLPLKERDVDGVLLTGAQMTRVREDTVAGLGCTVWSVRAQKGDGTICLTPDGVPLRVEGTVDGRRGSLEAVAVQLELQPPTLFQVPAGYMSFSLPKFK